MEFLSQNEKETAEIAKNFVEQIPLDGAHQGARVVGLYGELGSGKTTFMKYVAETLGVKEIIQSPTFVIMKKYELRSMSYERQETSEQSYLVSRISNFDFLFHIDAYRIEKEEEMINLGWQNLISDSSNLIFIEWPEKITSIMPPHIMIKFEHGQSENERKISIA